MAKRTRKTAQTVRPRSAVTSDGWTTSAPLEPLPMQITKQDKKNGVCKDPTACVVARSLCRILNPITAGVVDANIGTTRAEIILHAQKTVLRYQVPGVLKKALQKFDNTGEWGLDEGTYYLNPIPPSFFNRKPRFDILRENNKGKKKKAPGKLKKRGSVNVILKARATPTRKMGNITDIKNAGSSAVEQRSRSEIDEIVKKAPKKKAAKRTPKKKGNK